MSPHECHGYHNDQVAKGYTEFQNLATPATISNEPFDFARHIWNVGFNADDMEGEPRRITIKRK